MKTTIKNLVSGSDFNLNSTVSQIAYLLFRLHVGISIAFGAGLAKVFHKINEKGEENWDNLAFGVPEWFIDQVSNIGFTFISPSFWAHLAVYGEFIGGLLIALGLFTRLSAFQLAFQFFVISFVWYDEPLFIRGMYYQQLFFWAFVLIAVLGGGRLSLDYLIMNAKTTLKTIPIAMLWIMATLMPSLATQAQQTTQQEPTLVTFTLKNSAIIPRKLTVISYSPSETGNNTQGGYLMPKGTKKFRFKEGTKIYLASQSQVQVVMSGKRIDSEKPFLVVTKQNEGQTIMF